MSMKPYRLVFIPHHAGGGTVIKLLDCNNYIEDKAYIIHIHDSSEVRHYSTLEQLLEDNFEEFV